MRRPAAALFLVLACGCLKAPTPDSSPPPADMASTNGLPFEASGALTEFAWSSAEIRGDAGIVLRLRLTQGTHCSFTGAMAQTTGRSGPLSAFAGHGAGLDAWSLTATAGSNEVHAGGLYDSRQERGPGTSLEARRITFELDGQPGDVVLVLLARDLEPWPNTLLSGGSLLVEVKCDAAFQMGTLWATRVFTLVDQGSIAGGAGGRIEPVASLSLLDEVKAPVMGSHGQFVWGSIGGAGLLTLDHPKGSEHWPISGGQTYTFAGAPGSYRAAVDRAGADFDYFFAGLADMREVASLEELRALPSS